MLYGLRKNFRKEIKVVRMGCHQNSVGHHVSEWHTRMEILLPTGAPVSSPSSHRALFYLPHQYSVMHSHVCPHFIPFPVKLTRETQDILTYWRNRGALNHVYCWMDLLKPIPALVVPCPTTAQAHLCFAARFLITATEQKHVPFPTCLIFPEPQARGPRSQLVPRQSDFPC